MKSVFVSFLFAFATAGLAQAQVVVAPSSSELIQIRPGESITLRPSREPQTISCSGGSYAPERTKCLLERQTNRYGGETFVVSTLLKVGSAPVINPFGTYYNVNEALSAIQSAEAQGVCQAGAGLKCGVETQRNRFGADYSSLISYTAGPNGSLVKTTLFSDFQRGSAADMLSRMQQLGICADPTRAANIDGVPSGRGGHDVTVTPPGDSVIVAPPSDGRGRGVGQAY